MELEPRHEQAILALMTEPTVIKAAEVTGVTPQTLYNWLNDPEFKAAYKAVRSQTMDQAITQIQRNVDLAINTLVKVMISDLTRDAARVRAAIAILDMAFKAYEIEQITERLTELEEKYQRLTEG